MTTDDDKTHELDFYEGGTITSDHNRVPTWLKWVYIIMPIWGIIWLFLYWNGLSGWLDRGYWIQLEKAANTTYPYINANEKSSNGN